MRFNVFNLKSEAFFASASAFFFCLLMIASVNAHIEYQQWAINANADEDYASRLHCADDDGEQKKATAAAAEGVEGDAEQANALETKTFSAGDSGGKGGCALYGSVGRVYLYKVKFLYGSKNYGAF